MKVSVVEEWILFILSSFIFQWSAELNAMNLCKALSKEALWATEGLELKNQEIRIQNGLSSVCMRPLHPPSIFLQFTVARTVCLNASARWLLRRVRFFPSWVDVNYTLRLAQLNATMVAYVTAAVEIICPALFNSTEYVCTCVCVCVLWKGFTLCLEVSHAQWPPPPAPRSTSTTRTVCHIVSQIVVAFRMRQQALSVCSLPSGKLKQWPSAAARAAGGEEGRFRRENFTLCWFSQWEAAWGCGISVIFLKSLN